LQIDTSYPRASNPSVTIFLQKVSLRLQILFLSTIFAVSASKSLSCTLEHATKPCPKQKKWRFIILECFHFLTQPARTTVYLESFARLGGRVIRVAVTAERVWFLVRAIVVVAIEAVTAVAVWHGMLLVTLLYEILHHFRQTSRTRLEITGAVLQFLTTGDLFWRWISQNAGELTLKEPLQARLHNRLGQLKPRPFGRDLRIDWLNFHRKRHHDLALSLSLVRLFHFRFLSLIFSRSQNWELRRQNCVKSNEPSAVLRNQLSRFSAFGFKIWRRRKSEKGKSKIKKKKKLNVLAKL